MRPDFGVLARVALATALVAVTGNGCATVEDPSDSAPEVERAEPTPDAIFEVASGDDPDGGRLVLDDDDPTPPDVANGDDLNGGRLVLDDDPTPPDVASGDDPNGGRLVLDDDPTPPDVASGDDPNGGSLVLDDDGDVASGDDPNGGRLVLDDDPTPDTANGDFAPQPGDSTSTPRIAGFRLRGNTTLSSDALQALLEPDVGEPVDFERLQEAAQRITDEYQRQGHTLARAYLPPQEIVDGVVEIVVVEGQIGEIRVEGNEYVSDDFIREHLEQGVEGGSLNTEALERALLVLNEEYKDLKVSTVLTPGEERGTVDLVANVEDPFPLSISASFNNYGSKFVSRNRFLLQLDAGDLLVSGSRLTLTGQVGENASNMHFGAGRFEVPINSYATKVGVFGTYGTFEVSREFAALGLRGTESSGGLFINHLLSKSRTFSLTGELGFVYKDSRFFLQRRTNAHDKLRTLYVQAQATATHWGGRTFATLNFTQGLGHVLDGMHTNDPKASRFKADNKFAKLSASFARIQPVTDMFSLFLSAGAQWANTSLVASEEWQVGGAGTVRGYSPGELSGDDGYFASAELRFAPLEQRDLLQLVIFADHGGKHRKKPLIGERSSAQLTGAGVGVRSHVSDPWYDAVSADVSIDVAWPISPEDNSLNERPTYYVSVALSF